MNVFARTVIPAALLLALASCRSYMQTNYFLINTEPAVQKAATQLPLTLAVNNLRSPSRYQDQMFWRTADFQVGFYEYSHWVEPPAEMVKRVLIHSLKNAELFQRVEPLGVAANPDLILQSNLDSFDQIITKEGTLAECALTLALIRGDNAKPVWSYEGVERVKQEGKGKFVAAMSEAAARVINNAIADMEKSEGLREMAGIKSDNKTPSP